MTARLLFHWSPSARRDSINKDGLRPDRPTVSTAAVDYVCFAISPSAAWALSGAQFEGNGSWDLWQAWDSNLPAVVELDGEIRTRGPVPPSDLWFVGSRTDAPLVAAPVVDDGRPGAWVDGIGWVALAYDLGYGDRFTVGVGGVIFRRGSGDMPASLVVIVVRWADGTIPTKPAAAPVVDVTALDEWAALVEAVGAEGFAEPGVEHMNAVDEIAESAAALVAALPPSDGA